jgi:cell division septation protein DedD
VQIFASGTRENARKVAEEARWRFSEHQVFILEQGGLHKVQVGNGLGRVQADQLKQRAKEQGFPGAFAIEVTFE